MSTQQRLIDRLPTQDRRCTTAPLLLLYTALTALFGTGEVAFAATDANESQASESCAALVQFNLAAVSGGPAVVTSAQIVAVPPGGLEKFVFAQSGYGSPADRGGSKIHVYCDVTGYVAPQNKFELKLPLAAEWNHRFFFYACGGFCGTLFRDACNLGLERGFASATGNGGHDSLLGFDGAWAANAPELQEDFGWRSNHVITLVAKALILHYYGRPIEHSYMAGNSKGGQAVLLEAQRFPEDFDAMMPSAPVYDYTGRNTVAAAWFAQAITDGHGGSVLNADAAQAAHKSVLEHCGAQTGTDEGIVADPPSCDWHPEMIACAQGTSTPDCLSPKQVTAVRRLMEPPTNSKGEVIYAYPYIPGTETQWVGWNYFGAPRTNYPPRLANLELPGQFIGYMADATVRHNVDALKFNFDRDPATLVRARRIYDATSFDLRAFKARGGKILMWHGWADGAIMATSSIGYYEGVTKMMGGLRETQTFFRLFLVPGVHHGSGGPGYTEFDTLTALEDWVEKGQPPERLIAGRLKNGVLERTRPVYPYPLSARYSGTGDPTQASSFVPVDPSRH
jgi:hypothetical protein